MYKRFRARAEERAWTKTKKEKENKVKGQMGKRYRGLALDILNR